LLNTLSKAYNNFQSFNYRHRNLSATAFEKEMLVKGLLLNNKEQLLSNLMTNTDEKTQSQYKEWQQLNRFLASQLSLPKKNQSPNLDSLLTLANQLESELARSSVNFKHERAINKFTTIQQKLKAKEAVIEFNNFQYIVNGQPTDSVFYAALVLKPNDSLPVFVPLFEEKQLITLLKAKKKNNTPDDLYSMIQQPIAANRSRGAAQSATSRGANSLYSPTSTMGLTPKVKTKNQPTLHQLIWQPLDSILADIATVYYAPSGLLHRINLAAIPATKEKMMMDQFELVQLSSTRQLMSNQQAERMVNTAALFGGVSFDVAASQPPSASDSTANKGSWNPLTYTIDEVTGINELLSTTNFTTQLFTGSTATEAAFKALGSNNTPSPNILHIATHGYFFADNPLNEKQDSSQMTAFELNKNPMFRSGLILSGGNYAWQGNIVPIGQEDGILTAYEISQLNLRNTALVVLSACETGLGDINNSEGVYGLQRAFKMAGVKNIIMSLWQVPDRQTALLMNRFYKNWVQEKLPLRKAFTKAQAEMQVMGLDPFYWAGFVLVE